MTTGKRPNGPAGRSQRPPSAPSMQSTAPGSLRRGPILTSSSRKPPTRHRRSTPRAATFFANNEDLSKAKDQFSDSIRKNPLAAVGIAFTAGLLLALLTRG